MEEYFSSKDIKYLEKKEKFRRQLVKVQIELTKLQEHIQATNKKVLIIFEGRDASGKGSMIKTFMKYLNPRFARVVALGIPTEKEKSQWYFQRYVHHLPSDGEMVFFDRSWYNRAMVEPVMGFCTKKQNKQFLKDAPLFENLLKNEGIHIFKFYFSIKKNTQKDRFDKRKTNILKHYKLSPVDLKAQRKWDDFTRAKNIMFLHTNTKENPWVRVVADKKKTAKLNCIKYILSQFDYKNKDNSVVKEVNKNIIKDAS